MLHLLKRLSPLTQARFQFVVGFGLKADDAVGQGLVELEDRGVDLGALLRRQQAGQG